MATFPANASRKTRKKINVGTRETRSFVPTAGMLTTWLFRSDVTVSGTARALLDIRKTKAKQNLPYA